MASIPTRSELPSGFNRGDGLEGRIGTPTPKSARIVQSSDAEGNPSSEIVTEEFEDSPEIERAEQATLTHRMKIDWNEAVTQISGLGRGTVKFDSYGNVTKILSSKIQHNKGGWATLTVTAEGVSFDTPPDQFSITPVELGINILKHPRYFYAFLGPNGYGSTEEVLNQYIIRFLQDYFENPNAVFRTALTNLIFRSIGTQAGVGTQPPKGFPNPGGNDWTKVFGTGSKIRGTDIAKRAALEIIHKFWRGEENPYVIGYQINHSFFSFRPPFMNPGGYIEDPIYQANPQLPDYFWSPDYPPSARTIFDDIIKINPQCYSSNGKSNGQLLISWLRKADQMEEQRTWFKLDRTWIGSPVGFWDSQLNTKLERPTTAALYDPKTNPNGWMKIDTTT